MAKSNRECYTCGKEYYYCPTCPSETKKETFYNMFHCERCSKIFKTLTDETFKHITTAQCKEQLIKLNVSTNEEFKDGIKKHVKRVFDYKEPIVETVVDTVVEQVVENVVSETDVVKEVPVIETYKKEFPKNNTFQKNKKEIVK